jgi:hypothetical protein
LIRFDSFLVLVDLGPLGRCSFKVQLLLVNLDHAFLERNELQVDLCDDLVVVIFLLSGAVVFKFVNFDLYVIQVLSKLFSLHC